MEKNKYAVIHTGGKQYTVKAGDIIEVERLAAEVGQEVEFDVLLVNDGSETHVGGPHVDGFRVVGKLLGDVKGPKVNSLKYKPTQYKRFGHRQGYAQVEIQDIHHHKQKGSAKTKGVSHGT